MVRPVWQLLLLSLFFSAIISASSVSFNCTTGPTCQALVGYKATNATTVTSIKDLFEVRTLKSLLAANSWPLTDTNRSIPAGSVVRVPFPCLCRNGTGISNRRPVYTVQAGDDLDTIARSKFNLFVTYQEIAAVNNIPNPNLIKVGQNLWIPLPCSCDDVEGDRAVHYAHVVESGSSVAEIAQQLGTTEDTLMKLNGIKNPKDLLAGAILDVPLKACSSSIANTSLDSSLLVPNGSYALTANNCIQCSCNSTDLILQCKEVQGVKLSKWNQCPVTQCTGNHQNLSLGEALPASCSVCAYAGYTNSTILSAMTNQSICSTGGAPESQPSSDSNSAQGLGGHEWRWKDLFMSLAIGLLCSSFPW